MSSATADFLTWRYNSADHKKKRQHFYLSSSHESVAALCFEGSQTYSDFPSAKNSI
jgi:hypothetical protein